MPTTLDLYDLAARHHGVLTLADLERAGVTRSRRRTMVARGTLEAVAPRTFRVAGAPRSNKQAMVIACAATGGVASHLSAAWLHAVPGFAPPRPPQVLVDRRRFDYRVRVASVHTTTWLPDDDVHEVEGVPCTSVARTLFSLASMVPTLPEDRVRGAVDDAVRLGLASDPWLWSRLEKLRCRGRGGVSALESILSDRAGLGRTESWLERRFLELMERGGLPRPRCQERISAQGAFVARADFLYQRHRVVIEVTGAVAHASPAQRAKDAARRNRLLTAGYLVLEFTYEQVVHSPELVIREVRAALTARSAC